MGTGWGMRTWKGPVFGACLLSLSPPNSRSVLQSINPDEPHKECPNPKPGTDLTVPKVPGPWGLHSHALSAPFGGSMVWSWGPQANGTGQSCGGTSLGMGVVVRGVG